MRRVGDGEVEEKSPQVSPWGTLSLPFLPDLLCSLFTSFLCPSISTSSGFCIRISQIYQPHLAPSWKSSGELAVWGIIAKYITGILHLSKMAVVWTEFMSGVLKVNSLTKEMSFQIEVTLIQVYFFYAPLVFWIQNIKESNRFWPRCSFRNTICWLSYHGPTDDDLM